MRAATIRACGDRDGREFGVQRRGGLYDQTGTIRDVVQNHLIQVWTNLTMGPPIRPESEFIRDEKVKVL